MSQAETSVVIIGGGAAGIAAGRRLQELHVACVILEARPRLGGRSWTIASPSSPSLPLDLGCGWLHSADRNPWCDIARAEGLSIDKTPPPWTRPSLPMGFPLDEQKRYIEVLRRFRQKMDDFPEDQPDVAASTLLEPGNRWNALIAAATTYISGTEPDRLSARDIARYADTGVNWRVTKGYGSLIAQFGAPVPATLESPVTRIDHGGRRLTIESAKGTLTADAVIVTVPSRLLAEERIRFTPTLPEKAEAATGLPLGLADKLFLALDGPQEFDSDSRLFGHTDRSATAAYHVKPFGRPMIEAYFGGHHAAELEAAGGQAAFVESALSELTALLGSDIKRRLTPLAHHGWASDPFAGGSYSFALPGRADCRAALAAPVDNRLFFAGEACSTHDYSTAHGAYLTGVAAANHAAAALSTR